MKMFAFCVCILFGVSPYIAWANNTFNEATRAYNSGNTKQALKLFLSIEKKTPHLSPQLSLNIALLYLKSRQYELASSYLNKLMEQPQWRMLASYYLGLVANQKGADELANQYLTQVINESSNAGLVEKAKRALEQVAGAPSVSKHMAPSYYASFTSGYEDNALALPSDQLGTELQAEDSFNEIFVQGDLDLTEALLINGYVSARHYSEYSDLNTRIVNLGAEYQLLEVGKASAVTVDVSEVWADGNSIYHQWQGQLTSTFDVYTQDIEASFGLQQILANNEFSFLNGYQYQVALNKDGSRNRHEWNVNYHYQINDREDLQTADEFSSYSVQRHRLSISDDVQLINHFTLSLLLSISSLEWRGTNLILNQEDDIKRIKRQADQYQLKMAMLYEIASEIELSLAYEYLDNSENINTNSYTNSQFTITLAFEH